jgi:vacuolar protein sorting-associated protein 13A/C
MEPAIFSYPEIDHSNRAQITIDESKWSEVALILSLYF